MARPSRQCAHARSARCGRWSSTSGLLPRSRQPLISSGLLNAEQSGKLTCTFDGSRDAVRAEWRRQHRLSADRRRPNGPRLRHGLGEQSGGVLAGTICSTFLLPPRLLFSTHPFRQRGTGLSDRVPIDRLPTIEQRMDDVRVVMDAAGLNRAAPFGVSEGGPMCSVFAATFAHRTSALVMYGSYAKRVWDPEYPWAPRPEERERWYTLLEPRVGLRRRRQNPGSECGRPGTGGSWMAGFARAEIPVRGVVQKSSKSVH